MLRDINRQAAVKAIAAECDRMFVIGAPNSSNSLRLAEVAERMGVPRVSSSARPTSIGNGSASPDTVGHHGGCLGSGGARSRSGRRASRTRFDVTRRVADHSPERMTSNCPRARRLVAELAARRDFHGRCMPGKSGPWRLGSASAHGRKGTRDFAAASRLRPTTAWSFWRRSKALKPETAVPRAASHGQHLCSRRDHPLDSQLAAQRLADVGQEAGQER